MIKHEFLKSARKYASSGEEAERMWLEIENKYSGSDRHYHNLDHLNAMLTELTPHQDKFRDWDTIVFAIAYHDFVYSSLKKNNEERSAEIAVKRLSGIGVPPMFIKVCEQLILATKKHEQSDLETDLFTDADLSILGADSDKYEQYSKQIRREYSIYPDMLYYPGRKKVLIHFLEMRSIFKSKEFSSKYEHTARQNIQREVAQIEKNNN